MATPSHELPLSGLRVVDLTHVISGPFTSQVLGDLGADVIKIEEPRQGDAGRHLAPFAGDQSHYFPCFNRNKRSIALDLKSPDGLAIAKRLIAAADILVENFAPDVLARLGLGYDVARLLNPKIIYCSISGFGQTGPDRNRRYYDLIGQAYAGVMTTNGERGGGPIKVGIPVGDTTGALFSVVAILAAVNRRHVSGEGQHIDMSLTDCLLAVLANYGGYYFATGEQPERTGSDHYFSYPCNAYEVSDGYIVVATSTDEQWQRFCSALELFDFAADSALATRIGRARLRLDTDRKLGPRLRGMTQTEVIDRLDRVGIPCSAVNTIEQALNCAQSVAHGMVDVLHHPVYGEQRVVASPLGRDLTRRENIAPPLLGEHTSSILSELGYAADEIIRLMNNGVIATAESQSGAPHRIEEAPAT